MGKSFSALVSTYASTFSKASPFFSTSFAASFRSILPWGRAALLPMRASNRSSGVDDNFWGMLDVMRRGACACTDMAACCAKLIPVNLRHLTRRCRAQGTSPRGALWRPEMPDPLRPRTHLNRLHTHFGINCLVRPYRAPGSRWGNSQKTTKMLGK